MTAIRTLFLIFQSLLVIVITTQGLYAQDNFIKFSLGEYNFKAIYDTVSYGTSLNVNKKGTNIFSRDFTGRITSIKADNLNKEGQTNIYIDNFTGGAHCCFNLYIGYVSGNDFILSDSLYLGNSGYEIKDLNGDEAREILTASDVFAYQFTNYAQSMFSPLVYTIENNKFVNVTNKFPDVINKDIETLKSNLKQYTEKGFSCPETDTSETFNTDAGAVKAILAPMVMDYYNLGEVKTGYDFVISVYKCPDRNNFIELLQNEYKLK